MKLGDNVYSKDSVYARVGRLGQVGGVRRFVLQEGYEAGSEIIQIDTGAGFRVWVSPSKGMDIVEADYCGSSLCWQANNGVVHPSYYNCDELGWLDSYSSGLLTTCGLNNVGSPCEDQECCFGLHGRMHNTPAQNVTTRTYWDGDECHVEVCGVVCETKMFGYRLQLTRKITAVLGVNRVNINDSIENLSGKSVPLMILYHCNFGFPLLGEKTEIEIPSSGAEPREEDLGALPENWQKPVIDYFEKVYFHTGIKCKDYLATATIKNPEFPIGNSKTDVTVEMSWNIKNLPELIEWYMPGYSTHALGIEPANCRVFGRAVERASGRLEFIESGEIKDYMLSFTVI